MALNSHPVHPALVHFPVACWSIGTVADLAGLRFGEPAWMLAGVLIAIGCVMALVAMTAGSFELARIPQGSAAMKVALWHMGAASTAFILYGASLLLRFGSGALGPPDQLAIGLSVAGFLALAITGWLGGTLVYTHGVGVRAR